VDEQNWAFFDGDGAKIIENCFFGVLRQNFNNDTKMPTVFRNWLVANLSFRFEWPNNRAFGNAFRYMYEQYTDNVTTNIRYRCEQRLKMFFKMTAYQINDHILRNNIPNVTLFTDDDCKNALNYCYHRRDTTNGDAEAEHHLGVLLDKLREIGAPPECNISGFVEDNWFKSIKMWVRMQRMVEQFHIDYANVKHSWYLFKKFPNHV